MVAQANNLALVTRTEYPDAAARTRRAVCAALLVSALPALFGMVIGGAPPQLVVLVVGGLITVALGWGFAGARFDRRAGVRLGLVDGQILIGTEATKDTVRPLADLSDVGLSAHPSDETHIDPARRDLRVQGVRYLQLTFRDGAVYHVALVENDPVAAEILRRLKRAVPEKHRKYRTMKPAGERAATRPAAAAPVDAPETIVVEPSASPAADVRLWEAAREMHRRVLTEYGAYELDPALYLRYPGVTDITREHVMDFHTALAEAQALATDSYPGDAEYAGRYRKAADALRRQWARCERDGKATGTSYLADDDRADLDTAVKLYNHAQATDQPGEKTTYLRKVQEIVVDLDGRGRVHLPRPVVAAIESQVRLALGPGA